MNSQNKIYSINLYKLDIKSEWSLCFIHEEGVFVLL